jgi:hypothetical protein
MLKPNLCLEFHDSEVRSVEPREGSLTVTFSAAHVHRSNGRPGIDSGSGYVQSFEMQFLGATWHGPTTECVGRLSGGIVISNDKTQSLIELPFSSSGPVSSELQFSNGSLLSVRAQKLVCGFTGEPNFVETFRC